MDFPYLGLYVDPENLSTSINKIRTGSVEEQIVVKVRQSNTSECIIFWDTKDDNQSQAFDVGLNSKVFWDQDGVPYVTENDIIYFSQEGVRLKCHDIGPINAAIDKN